jgi:hypothetical protein
LQEEHRLKVLIIGVIWAQEQQGSRGLKELQSEERPDFYCWTNIILVIKSRKMRWTGNVSRMWERIGAYGGLVGKSEGKRPLGKT